MCVGREWASVRLIRRIDTSHSANTTSLDITWIKDDSLTDLENLPEPEVLAGDILENLEAGLESFRQIVEELRIKEIIACLIKHLKNFIKSCHMNFQISGGSIFYILGNYNEYIPRKGK